MKTARKLLADLEHNIDDLDEMRRLLVSSIGYTHPVINKIAEAYKMYATLAASRYHELLAAFKGVRRNPEPPLEVLERAFLVISRNAIEARHASDRAARSKKRNRRNAAVLRVVADKMEHLAQFAARNLLKIAEQRGTDVEWIIREYRLSDWL